MYELRTSEVVIVINEKQDIVMCSKDSFEILGYLNTELIGQKITVLMDEKKARVHQIHIDNYIEKGSQRPDVGKFEAIRKDGSRIPVYVWIHAEEAIKIGDGKYLVLGGVFDAETVDKYNDVEKRYNSMMKTIQDMADAWMADKRAFAEQITNELVNIKAMMGIRLNPLMDEDQKQMSINIINEGGKSSQDTNIDKIDNSGEMQIGDQK